LSSEDQRERKGGGELKANAGVEVVEREGENDLSP